MRHSRPSGGDGGSNSVIRSARSSSATCWLPRVTQILRRVRPTFSGTVYKYVDYFFRPDFGQGTTVIYDAYLELTYFPAAKVRVGKFKPPVGLERLQSDREPALGKGVDYPVPNQLHLGCRIRPQTIW